MLPFDSYRCGDRKLLGLAKDDNCRRGYGSDFMRLTGQSRCAYCDADFTVNYKTWLTMVLDHVVPASVCKLSNVPPEWCEDFSNTVLACAACNGFCNRYRHSGDVVRPLTLDAFYDFRDRIFSERKYLIEARQKDERKFFDTRPWEPV